ncbi:MAG: ankyrin repeat domain-containing protein [Deltaproteobacteria bacterium]|nr:ankyrin repeat domain-containing protein [Deltaproteobacteria bacterium]
MNGWAPLFWAARNGHRAVAELLIQAGADVNQADNDGRSPLYWAAWQGKKDIVELLIAAGADVKKDKSGCKCSVMYASRGILLR